MNRAEVTIRPGYQPDYNHILTEFRSEYRHSHHGKPMSEKLIGACLMTLIASPDWKLDVAVPMNGSDEIYGWILHSGRNVAWVSTKVLYRRHGVARALLKLIGVEGGEVFTPFLANRNDVSNDFTSFAASKGFKIRHRPHLLLEALIGG